MVDKNWTFEQATAAQELAETEGRTGPETPLYQWVALHDLDRLKAQFESGDRWALLAAVRKCANHSLVMPSWVANGFIAAYDTVLSARIGSWDEALGRPYPKGRHLHNARQDRERRFDVWLRIRNILSQEPDIAVDDALFERVGRELGIGKTRANRLYYEAERLRLSLPRKS
jgi:hypothetical protein